jgi:hypothetical protein
VLLASELVTNSVRHSGSRQLGQTITITAVLQDSEVRVEVTDSSGPTVPAMRAGGEIAEGGRGLQLVQALEADWGYWRAGSRTTTCLSACPDWPPATLVARVRAGPGGYAWPVRSFGLKSGYTPWAR